MKKNRPDNPRPSRREGFLVTEGPALLALLASLVFFFYDWIRDPSKIFLSLDTTDIYFPFYSWAHAHVLNGKLPLISDLSYHGAPMPAVVIVGFLSPLLLAFHALFSYLTAFNLLFLFPWALFLLGTYFLGRILPLSRTASLLLAFLWTYNGERFAHLDHLNITWACAFFPWVFWSLLRNQQKPGLFWLLLAGFLWGLNLLTGHPQIVFFEGLFLVFWALFSAPPPRSPAPWKAVAISTIAAFWTASPLILNSAECLLFDGFHFQWSEINRFFHSWTPLNFITLVFPWFFGRTQFDRQGTDYWWQYQFTEMQVAFSIAGLFFMALFFRGKNTARKWIGLTALFGILMALGKFSPLYPLVQSLPVFSWFRDPARYWFLASWALGLGAAYAWDYWFKTGNLRPQARKIAGGLAAFSLLFLATGGILLTWGRPLLDAGGSWFIRHFLLGDPLHPLPLSHYLDRLPEKWNALALNLDPTQPRVFLPLLFLLALNLAVFFRDQWNVPFQKVLLLVLVLADLAVFRAPLGNSFYSPSDIPSPLIPGTQNRILALLYETPSPLPNQYGEMAYANVNYLFQIPTLSMEANPQMNRYDKISECLGWFSWVYKDRDPRGFEKHPNLMRMLGIDLLVTDKSMGLSKPFEPVRDHYPFAYRLSHVLPRAYLADRFLVASWPDSIGLVEKPDFDPSREVVLDSEAGVDLKSPLASALPVPQVLRWDETRLSLSANTHRPSLLVLQKTFLPGWKAVVNGKPVVPLRCNLVLTAIPLSAGRNQVDLSYQPTGLKLGLFLFSIFLGVFAFSFFRLRFA